MRYRTSPILVITRFHWQIDPVYRLAFRCGGGGGVVEVAGRGWSLDGRVQGMLLATATACAIVLFCNM